jgi:hypothetical protein
LDLCGLRFSPCPPAFSKLEVAVCENLMLVVRDGESSILGFELLEL